MMLTCYFDESGGKDFEYTFVCGWSATVVEWQRFEYDWKLFLSKYDVPYLHMKEFSQSTGPFKAWKDKEGTRANFMRDAANIVSDTVRRGFVCCVSHEIFEKANRVYDLRGTLNSPYALAGRTCALMASDWLKEKRSSNDMEYVFEAGGPDEPGLLNAMTTVFPFLPNPIFKPSRDRTPCEGSPSGRPGTVQLQAADYLAYEMRKFMLDHMRQATGRTWKLRASLGALPGNKVQKLFFTSHELELLCRILKLNPR